MVSPTNVSQAPAATLAAAPPMNPSYDAMREKLESKGADHRIHGSMRGDLTEEQLVSLYDEFAPEYDAAYDAMDYQGPRNVAKALQAAMGAEALSRASVLDAGCGSGKVGRALKELGVGEVHGVDFSAGMLKIAEKYGYASLRRANLMNPLTMESNTFEAAVSTGVFTAGHVKKEALRELARVVRPGGFLCIGSQELVFESEGYPAFLEALKKEGVAELVGVQRVFTMAKTGTEMNVITIKVL